MITSSTESRIAPVIARKSSISYDGTPSGVRAWMWIIEPPSSTIRRASAPYSSGVYGIAGHCSRLAIAPEMAQVMTAGSSTLKGGSRQKVGRSTSHSDGLRGGASIDGRQEQRHVAPAAHLPR